MKTIELWLDYSTSGTEPAWIVDLDGQTLATFAEDDYADAVEFARDKCRATGYPVVEVGEHGQRETIYEIDRPVSLEG